jgi:hypothetical protein
MTNQETVILSDLTRITWALAADKMFMRRLRSVPHPAQPLGQVLKFSLQFLAGPVDISRSLWRVGSYGLPTTALLKKMRLLDSTHSRS